ncbi:hypothetical protein BDV25DRAFT_142516 [Aspergillus avenaceus]|uniref:Uncharacterized protein n=1 Tax=Aspergillus avenaceus TaxID=36643 RepID=A0A5N6TN28_ASPAV|nr:hypothetical protein BDV25DRAFT_142516 [Aspergillus avenaceus]
MSSPYAASWMAKDLVSLGDYSVHTPSAKSSKASVGDFSEWSEPEIFQDSVAKRRRHGVYFHRPPVWVSSSSPTDSWSTAWAGCKVCHQPEGECICLDFTSCEVLAKRSVSFSSSMNGEQLRHDITAATADALAAVTVGESELDYMPLLASWRGRKSKRYALIPGDTCSWSNHPSSSEEPLDDGRSSQSSYRQVKPGLCTRLESQKDIRLGADERWAIQEGSLVISIDPSYTLLGRERQPDEFEIVAGDVYVICRLYADLWALCVKASFIPQSEPHLGDSTATNTMQLAFIPLCAVTLAANFCPFSKRCSRYVRFDTNEPRHPGNGLPVIPPPRSHSLNASKQMFRGNKINIQLPDIVYDTFGNTPLTSDLDYIPLDSTLEQVLARVRNWGRRPLRIRGLFALQRAWNGVKTTGIQKYGPGKWLLSRRLRNRSSRFWASGGTTRYHLLKERRRTSSESEQPGCSLRMP